MELNNYLQDSQNNQPGSPNGQAQQGPPPPPPPPPLGSIGTPANELPQQAPPQPIPGGDKKTRSGLIIGCVVIIIILGLLAVAGAGVYYFYFYDKGEETTDDGSGDSEAESGGDTSDVTASDKDGDKLSDEDEERFATDPYDSDTDGDGFTDGDEVEKGYDPLGPGLKVEISTEEVCPEGMLVFRPIEGESVSERAQVNLEIILDASGSMKENVGGKKKIDVAKEVVAQIIDSLPEDRTNLNVGFRSYGYQGGSSGNDCNNTKLLVPINGTDKKALKSAVSSIAPGRGTPIAKSLEAAGKDFPRGENTYNSVILISDGLESCGGDPKNVAGSIYHETGLKINTHVVGFGIAQADEGELKGIARNSGGLYNTAQNSEELKKALDKIIENTVTGGSMRVRYVDQTGKPVPRSYYTVEGQDIFGQFGWETGEASVPLPEGTYTINLDDLGTEAMQDPSFQVVIKEGFETFANVSMGLVKLKFPKAETGEQPTLDAMGIYDRCAKKSVNENPAFTDNWPTPFSKQSGTEMSINLLPGVYQINKGAPRFQKVVGVRAGEESVIDLTGFFGIISFTEKVQTYKFPNLTRMEESTFEFPCCSTDEYQHLRESRGSATRLHGMNSVYAHPGDFTIRDTPVTVEPGKTVIAP
ncbi:VWA domain-containing protein [Patescibacteria group bacterium]